MKRTILAAVLLAGTAFMMLPAQADVFLDTNGLGGTGNNVVFSSIFDNRLVLGTLNGQNDEVVRFRDMTATQNPLFPFSGFSNTSGNDIKIINTNDLDITVFDAANLLQLGTTRDIFSLKGTGSVFIRVDAVDANGNPETFNFGSLTLAAFQLSLSAQQGFDLTATNGEVIKDIDIFLVGANSNITDFEHYRIDAAVLPVAVPGPVVGAGIPGLAAVAMFGLNFWRRRRNGGTLPA
jgi:hypothetical protein